MKEVIVGKSGSIALGIQGEKNAVKIKFPVNDIFADYKDELEPSYELYVQKPGETTAYKADTSLDEGDSYSEDKYVVWTPSSDDLENSGVGYCELRLVGDDLIAKSTVYTTNVIKSMEVDGL